MSEFSGSNNIDIISRIVANALIEDIGTGDVTTNSTIPKTQTARAVLHVKQDGVISGLTVVQEVFRQVDPELDVKLLVTDGEKVTVGTNVAELKGSARSILLGERVALNFLQRLSGIAALTSKYVAAVVETKARIVDTRKTTPGLRVLEKMAVRHGGGHNHRMALYDAVMIKDNHIIASGGISKAVSAARKSISHTMTITVECESLEQVQEALNAGADILLLDNMDLETRTKAVNLAAGKALTEASGGINLNSIAEVAKTGVDIISVGALTHSAPSLDISLDLFLFE